MRATSEVRYLIEQQLSSIPMPARIGNMRAISDVRSLIEQLLSSIFSRH